MAGFLGVLDEGRIELTQTGLIKRILEAMGIEGANPKSTSAETEPLPSDKTGSLTEQPFNYASVIGMLQYLQGHKDQTFLLQLVNEVNTFIVIPTYISQH